MVRQVSRRLFLYLSIGGVAIASFFLFRKLSGLLAQSRSTSHPNQLSQPISYIYVAKNGTPEQNIAKVIEMMGGIEKFIGVNDIVILKPNAQWWHQGGTNTDAMKEFIELVLKSPQFKGEIIIAENHHLNPVNSRGWTHQEYNNGKYNLNELIEYFSKKGIPNVTKYHWIDAEQRKYEHYSIKGILNGPEEGDGYVWEKDNIYLAPNGLKAMMSYPIFTSSYSGITIDLKKGAWKNGEYINKPVKLINFSALNHHSKSFGVTASVKNHLGIVDLTCGFPGKKLKGLFTYDYFNFHYIGCASNLTIFGEINQRMLRHFGRWTNYGGQNNHHYMGGAVGWFMNTVRSPDLNIITAEWVGYGSRTNLALRKQTKTILASTDPVALDFYAAKYVLLPATKEAHDGQPYIELNDPENPDNPFRKCLIECHKQGIGTLDEANMVIHEYAFSNS